MDDSPSKSPAKTVFRVFSKEAKAYLTLDSVNGKRYAGTARVEVDRPVSRGTLDQARIELVQQILAERALEDAERAKEDEHGDETDEERVQQEIDAALKPLQDSGLLGRAWHVVASILVALVQLMLFLAMLYVVYYPIQYSDENLPTGLNLALLALYALALCFGIWLIATEENRWRWSTKIREWFGPRGLLILPGLILVASAGVFASFTSVLFERGLVVLTPCAGFPVSTGRLLDFYMWHFMRLVPLVDLIDVLKWEEPLCYSQAAVGFLILLFQAFVVIPTIATARFYWKNRDTLSGPLYEYVSGPEPQSSRRPSSEPDRPASAISKLVRCLLRVVGKEPENPDDQTIHQESGR